MQLLLVATNEEVVVLPMVTDVCFFLYPRPFDCLTTSTAFRDRTNARNNPNRDNPVENTDGTVRGRDSGPGTQRGGRGPRGPRRGGDRHVNRSGRA